MCQFLGSRVCSQVPCFRGAQAAGRVVGQGCDQQEARLGEDLLLWPLAAGSRSPSLGDWQPGSSAPWQMGLFTGSSHGSILLHQSKRKRRARESSGLGVTASSRPVSEGRPSLSLCLVPKTAGTSSRPRWRTTEGLGARRQGPSGAIFKTAHHNSHRPELERLSLAASSSLVTWEGTPIFLGGLSSIPHPF